MTPPSVLTESFQATAIAALAATKAPPTHASGDEPDDAAAEVLGNAAMVTHQSVIYPWHCDHMGHMNVMWYTSKFDEATWRLFAELGMTSPWLQQHGRGMAVIEQNTKYVNELNAGDVIEISSRLLESHRKALVFEHTMMNIASGQVAAVSKLTGVHIDTIARRSAPLPPQVTETAADFLATGSLPPT